MIIDIAVIIVVFLSALIAFIRGFIREVLTIAGVVSGAFGAWLAGPKLAPIFKNWFGVDPDTETTQKLFDVVPLEWVAIGSAYAVVFIFIVIIISVLSHFLAESLKAMGLGAVDRTLGVMFGIARGVLLVGLFYLPFHLFMEDSATEGVLKESKTAFYLDYTAKQLAKLLPDDIGEKKEDTQSDTRDQLKELKLLKDENGEDVKINLPTIEIKKDDVEGVLEGYKDNFRDNMNDLIDQKQQREEPYNE